MRKQLLQRLIVRAMMEIACSGRIVSINDIDDTGILCATVVLPEGCWQVYVDLHVERSDEPIVEDIVRQLLQATDKDADSAAWLRWCP